MDVLPDSRLKDRRETVVADWKVCAGLETKTIRMELEPIFCFNCGKPNGYVPVDIMSFVSWLCEACSEAWGNEASLHTHSDQAFWDKVGEEMLTKFGRSLTQAELWQLAQQGRLGRGLELLERESPYRRA
jgi:hypothetical protein